MGSQEQPRFIFVGGCERSGTSLLQQLLCAHSRIAGGPELMFSGRIAALHRHMSWILTQGPNPHRERLGTFLGPDDLDRRFRGFYGSFFHDLVKGEAHPEPPVFVSEKTPSNIFSARSLLGLFPNSLFVHLIRDGRDVVASHRDVLRRARAAGQEGRAPVPSLRRVCERWNRAIAQHFELLGDPEIDGRYHWLRFEDLLRDPEETLTDLMAFLDLELEVQQLQPDGMTEPMPRLADGVWHVEEPAAKALDGGRVGRWRKDLALGPRLLAECRMAASLTRLDYPTSRPFVRIGRLLAALRRLARRTPRR